MTDCTPEETSPYTMRLAIERAAELIRGAKPLDGEVGILCGILKNSAGHGTVTTAWKPIETAPKVEFDYLLGYDTISAATFGDPASGVCVISWVDSFEGLPPGWEVQPFAENLGTVCSDVNITHWMPLPGPPEDAP